MHTPHRQGVLYRYPISVLIICFHSIFHLSFDTFSLIFFGLFRLLGYSAPVYFGYSRTQFSIPVQVVFQHSTPPPPHVFGNAHRHTVREKERLPSILSPSHSRFKSPLVSLLPNYPILYNEPFKQHIILSSSPHHTPILTYMNPSF